MCVIGGDRDLLDAMEYSMERFRAFCFIGRFLFVWCESVE